MTYDLTTAALVVQRQPFSYSRTYSHSGLNRREGHLVPVYDTSASDPPQRQPATTSRQQLHHLSVTAVAALHEAGVYLSMHAQAKDLLGFGQHHQRQQEIRDKQYYESNEL